MTERAEFMTLEAVPNLWETVGILQGEGALSTLVIDLMWGEAIRGGESLDEAP